MWILPSLGRPERAQEVAEAIPDDPITLRLHLGDPKLEGYVKVKWPKAWTIQISKQLSLAETLNWALENYPDEESYGFLADDTIPEPEDWRDALEYNAGYWNVAFPDDGIHRHKLCTHHCIGGRLMRQVGFWALPGLKHNFLDNVWYLIGKNLGCLRYTPYVKFNHRHMIRDASLKDSTYRIGMNYYKHDEAVFREWIRSGVAEDSIRTLQENLGIV